MPSEVTLQINLSGGDVSYAETTVPPLVAAHRATVREVLGVVDCVRPQRTQMVDPDVRFPPDRFNERCARIRSIAEKFVHEGTFDRVVYVEPGDPRTRALLTRYAGWPVVETHDCYGCGLVSYLYGFDEARTRYLLHYDADMLLHQAVGYDWSVEGLEHLSKDPRAISATPRVSPPFARVLGTRDSPSLQAAHPALEPHGAVWHIGWFSARCFLLDLERLRHWLPLLSARRPRYFGEVCARRILARGYPPAVEVLIHLRAKGQGAYRVDLVTEKAFVVHPNNKDERFLRMLPGMLDAIRSGAVPAGQRGWENVILEAWEGFAGVAAT